MSASRVGWLAFVLAALSLQACQLPARRPDATVVVRDCDTGFELAGLIGHGTCLVLDAAGSSASGTPTYTWTRTVGGGTAQTIGFGQLISGTFFQDFPIRNTQAQIGLTITDGNGHDRTLFREFFLDNEPPVVRVRDRVLVAKNAQLERLPLLVVRPDAVDPDRDAVDSRVTQIGLPALVDYECADAPTHGYPDPAPGESAWCFEIEDLLDTMDEPVSFRFRVEVFERNAPVPGVVPDVSVTETEYLVSDAVWATTNFGGEATRVNSGWKRRTGIEAVGSAIESLDDRTWVPIRPGSGGAGAGETEGTQEIAISPGNVIGAGTGSELGGFAPGQPDTQIEGLGQIYDVKAGKGRIGGTLYDGLWVLSMASDSAGNPSATAGDDLVPDPTVRYVVPPGEIFLVFVRDLELGASRHLAEEPRTVFRFVSGFGDPDVPTGFVTPLSFESTASGDLWIATREDNGASVVDRLRRIASTDGGWAVSSVKDIDTATDLNAGGTFRWRYIDDPKTSLNLLSASGDDMWVALVDAAPPAEAFAQRWTATGADPNLKLKLQSGPGVRWPEYVLQDPTTQSVWALAAQTVGNSTVRSLMRASGTTSSQRLDVIASFDRPTELLIDGAGALWVDEVLQQTFGTYDRRLSYLAPGATPSEGVWPLQTSQPFRAKATGLCRAGDAVELADWGGLAKVPASQINEIGVRQELPLVNRLAGVDTRDGSAILAGHMFHPGIIVSRVDAMSGESMPILVHSSATIVTATLMPPLRKYDDDQQMTPGGLWVSVLDPNDVVHLGRLGLGSIDAIVRQGGSREWSTIPTCGASSVLPCWEVLRTGYPVVQQMTYSPVDDRIYFVGKPVSNEWHLLSFAAYGDGTPVDGGVLAIDADSEALAWYFNPLSPYIRFDGSQWEGGVWLAQSSRASLWQMSGSALVEHGTLQVFPNDPAHPPIAISQDPETERIWIAYRTDGDGLGGGVGTYQPSDLPLTTGAPDFLTATNTVAIGDAGQAWLGSFVLSRVSRDGASAYVTEYTGHGANLYVPLTIWAGAHY